jgi:hypothetical protein
LSYFVDQRTKYRFNSYSSELQATRFRGTRHTAEHSRKMSEALKEAWKRVTPESETDGRACHQKCRPGCTCAKHKVRKGLGKGSSTSCRPSLSRQDLAQRRRAEGQMFLPTSFAAGAPTTVSPALSQ